MDKWMQLFSYSYKTGNIYECDKHIVKFEETRAGEYQFFTVQKKCKCVLRGDELAGFFRFASWLIDRGADLGPVHNYILRRA